MVADVVAVVVGVELIVLVTVLVAVVVSVGETVGFVVGAARHSEGPKYTSDESSARRHTIAKCGCGTLNRSLSRKSWADHGCWVEA